jgi:hypothetical protein
MTSYALTSDLFVVQRLDDGAFVPNDDRNPDWQAYQAWLADGNKPEPFQPPSIQKQLTLDDLVAALIRNKVITQADLDEQ